MRPPARRMTAVDRNLPDISTQDEHAACREHEAFNPVEQTSPASAVTGREGTLPGTHTVEHLCGDAFRCFGPLRPTEGAHWRSVSVQADTGR